MTSKTLNRHDFIAFLDQLEEEIPPDKEVVGIIEIFFSILQRKTYTGNVLVA